MTAHNDMLRAAREATPSRWFPGRAMSRSELAQLVVEQVWASEQVESPFDRKHIAKLEMGLIRYPSARYRRALRAILDARSDADLGFVSANRQRAARPLDHRSSWLSSGELGRLAGELGRCELGLATISTEVDEGSPGARARVELVRAAASTEAAGRQLLAALAERCQRAGLAAADAGHGRTASRCFMAGVRAAHAAGNDAFAAHLFSLLAYQESRDKAPAHRPPPLPSLPPGIPGPDDIDEAVRWAMQVTGHARVRASVRPPDRLRATDPPRFTHTVTYAELSAHHELVNAPPAPLPPPPSPR